MTTGAWRPLGVGGPDGRLLCDFCGALDPLAYYEVENFQLGPDHPAVRTVFDSGDRFYVCTICRVFIDADDWGGLRGHVGALANLKGVQVLWAGFRRHRRRGAAVEFPAGTNPEQSR